MKIITFTKLVHLVYISVLIGSFSAGAVAQKIADFALLDQHGKFHQLSYYKDSPSVALLVLPEKISSSNIQAYQTIAANEEFEDITFFYLTQDNTNRQQFKSTLEALGVSRPVLIDTAGLVAALLEVTRNGEALLLDPDRQNIVFRGAINQTFETALAQLASGQSVSHRQSSLEHLPLITDENTNEDVTQVSYAKDIAPILIKHCVTCHRDGGVAPFAMDSWGVVLGWSPMIKEVLLTKRMPPGQIDPSIGHFNNDRVLANDELRQLVAWIDAGGLNNDADDPLEHYKPPQLEWHFGEPDLVLELPKQTVPATGLIDFTDLVLPVAMPEDRWVRATQFIPGDHRVLHHVEAFVISSRFANQSGEGDQTNKIFSEENFLSAYSNKNNPHAAIISPYVPGIDPIALPENTGGLLKSTDQLAIQLHYAAIGREIIDNTRLGIWFYPSGQKPTDRLVVACTCLEQSQWQIIPAYAENFVAKAELALKDNVYLYSVLPQLHYRGSSIRFDAHLPNGKQEALLSIPNYNYNWQIDYQFAEPKYLPKGTKIIATAVYDNSNKNAFNPDASQAVPWGRESYNEILAGVLQWQVAD